MARHLRTYSVPLDHRKLLVWTECRPERAPQSPEETQATKHFIIRKKTTGNCLFIPASDSTHLIYSSFSPTSLVKCVSSILTGTHHGRQKQARYKSDSLSHPGATTSDTRVATNRPEAAASKIARFSHQGQNIPFKYPPSKLTTARGCSFSFFFTFNHPKMSR